MFSVDDFELEDDGGGVDFLDASGLSLFGSSFAVSLVDFGGLKYLSNPFGASLDVRILSSFRNASNSDNFSPFFVRNATSCLSCKVQLLL